MFTPAAAPLFNLIATDIGRPLGDLASRFIGVDLLADARAVLASLLPLKRQVRSGTGGWYLCSISPYRTQDSRIEGVIINLADISDFKASEESLRVVRAYSEGIEEIINTIHEPLVVLDLQLKVVSASLSFYSFFGCKPEETLGRMLPETDAHHLDTPALRGFLERMRSDRYHVENYEVAVDLPPHGKRTLLVTAELLKVAGTAEPRVLVSFNDVTDFRHNATQLAAAKQAAEVANLAKSRFLAVASHDLRQPLQALNFLHKTLKQQIKDEEALQLVDRADQTLATMSEMLSALLDINQLETGAIHPEFTEFPIRELFAALITEFAEQASRKGLRFHLVDCGHRVRSDRRLLEEMIRNLLSNAVRYTDKGKVVLGCRHRGGRLGIEVWDTGIGIVEEQIPRIFQEYHQVNDPSERGGLGLGLAIVQRLGEMLGHEVGVRSRVNKGSVFFILVPRASATAHPPKPTGSEQSRDKPRGETSVLIIEDDTAVREALALMLKQEGYAVTVATNGKSARVLVANGTIAPDLLIADFNLPGAMTGLRSAASVRTARGVPVPVIILSGDIRSSVAREIAESGYIGLTKPVKADELSQTIRRILDQLEPVGEAPQPVAATGATVFVIDDDRNVRDSMEILLSHAGYRVRTYADAKSFLNSFSPAEKGCLVTNVRMPGMGGFELLARLAKAGNHLPAIVITGQGDIAMAVQAMRAGAADFIEKPVAADTLLACIERTLRQAASPDARSAAHDEAAMRIAGLSKREREVMDLVVAGHPNKEIAARLGINQRTVESHRALVMKKMHAASLSELVRLEISAGDKGQAPH